MKELSFKGLLNTVAASGANVDVDANTGLRMIVADNTADPLVPVINFYFKKEDVEEVVEIAAAAEVRRTSGLHTPLTTESAPATATVAGGTPLAPTDPRA